MKVSLFSEFGSNGISLPNNSKLNNASISPVDINDVKENKNSPAKKMKAAMPYIVSAISIPVTTLIAYKVASKNTSKLKADIENLTREIAKLNVLREEQAVRTVQNIDKSSDIAKKMNTQVWSVLLAIAGFGGGLKAASLSDDDKDEISKRAAERITNIDNNSQKAVSVSQQALAANANSLSSKYTVNINGIQLLKNTDSLNKNEQKYRKAIETIQTAAPERLYNAPSVKPINKEHPTLWSVTSEFAPVKEGGLGSVPVEIQNNVTKLGINIPTFIPMYQQKGLASFREENGKYFYRYKGKEFELKKAVSFKLDTYQAGKSKTEDVEIFVNETKDDNGNIKQLIFIKNDNYFNGTIYQAGEKTEEPEKFAFFSKAVYELAKSKFDINSIKNLVVVDKEVYDSIKTPDAMVLNDWQASPCAALTRYKAPMENAFGQLSDDAAKKLSEMRIITIGHNTMYQGSTQNNNDNVQRKEATTNILNTLFDNFAYDIVSNAKTDASVHNPQDSGLKNLDNVLIMNIDDENANHTNLLNMGVCLSDYFHPVSQNYAEEIVSDNHPELAGEVRWALTQKSKAGSLVGIINGNDFNNLSIESKKGVIKKQTGLDFKTYSKSSNITELMNARKYNKLLFYNDYMLPFSQKNNLSDTSSKTEKIRNLTPNLELVDSKNNSNIPELTDEELISTPIISSVGRLVSQKGIPVMTGAIKLLFDNWEKDFPGKPKPIFYIAGQDGEGGIQRKYIENLKNEVLKEEDSNRIVFAHGFAPMAAMTAGSDFFLLPSIFEPCGLTQGESFAVATPVIGSSVGGIVDTVNRNGKNNGILTNASEPLSSKTFYSAMKEALNIYFNNPAKYQKMVKDSIDEDFSWIQPGKKGPVFDYLDKIGIERSKLPEVFN